MEVLFALVGFFVAVAFASLPIISLVLALQTRQRIAQLERIVRDLEAQRSSGAPAAARHTAPLAPPVSPAVAPAVVSTMDVPPREYPNSEPVQSAAPVFPDPPPSAPVAEPIAAAIAPSRRPSPPLPPGGAEAFRDEPAAPPFDWEGLIGVRLFAWLGGATFFVAAAFFLHYSIQHDLIPPGLRVGIGLLLGAAAFAGGDWVRAKADRAGQAVSGAGVGILYASIFAARSLYHLISAPVAFLGLIAVTAIAGVFAVRKQAYMVAVLGTIGGFLTPPLLATGENRPIALFAYLTLLDVGLVLVARRRQWGSILALGLVGSTVIFAGWAVTYLDSSTVLVALAGAAILAAVFAVTIPTSPTGAPRVVGVLASLAPLLLATIVAASTSLQVAPTTLVPYVLVVSAGAIAAGTRAASRSLAPWAAAFCVLTLLAYEPAGAAGNWILGLFLLIPVLYGAAYAWRRNAPDAAALQTALGGVLFGSLLIAARWHLRHDVLEAGLGTRLPLWPLVAYATAHVAGMIALGLVRRSGRWIAAAQGLALVHLVIACVIRGDTGRTATLLACVLVSQGGFWALAAMLSRRRIRRWDVLAGLGALLLHFPFVYALGDDLWGERGVGAYAVACGLLAMVLLDGVRRNAVATPADRSLLLSSTGATALLFATLAVPLLLDKEWITIAWAIEVTALAWLFRRVRHGGLLAALAGLALVVFLRLAVNPFLWAYHPLGSFLLFNWYLYTFALPTGAFLTAAQLLRGSPPAQRFRVAALLQVAAGLLVFVLLNTEIADAYSTGEDITFRLVGGSVLEDLTYSLAWGVYALALLALGLRRRVRAVRFGGLAVLLLTIGKVFFHDLWHLGALYRVASFMGLAIALLAVSFLTQRFLAKKAE